MALTGNHPLSEEPVTELEKRVISLIGKCYIEGHDEVKENVPAEEVKLIIFLYETELICIYFLIRLCNSAWKMEKTSVFIFHHQNLKPHWNINVRLHLQLQQQRRRRQGAGCQKRL